jgi:hypothetical protein
LFFDPKVDEIYFSEMSVYFQQSTGHYTPEDGIRAAETGAETGISIHMSLLD